MARVKVSLVGSKNENESIKKVKPLSPDAVIYQELYDAAATLIDKIDYELITSIDAEETLAAIQMWIDKYLLKEIE